MDERNDGAGSVNAAKIDETTGELTQLAPSVPAEVDLRPGAGAACCHISVTPGGKHVLAANYLGGSIVAIARKPDGSLDESTVQYLHFPPASHPIAFPMPNAKRQESSHAHMALASSGTKGVTILVPDLGSDVVWSVPYDASKPAASLGVPVTQRPLTRRCLAADLATQRFHPARPRLRVLRALVGGRVLRAR